MIKILMFNKFLKHEQNKFMLFLILFVIMIFKCYHSDWRYI